MLPNLIVIGAMKCGTSSLHYYLSLHPEIFMSERKELNFFIDRKNWGRGLDWYEAQFPEPLPVRGESSPGYTKYPTFEGVAERLHSVLPGAKLIYLVRDPIERIVSHYLDSYALRREDGTIEDMLADLDDNHYVNCSRYFMQLEQYLRYYPESQILIITSEELEDDRPATRCRGSPHASGRAGSDLSFPGRSRARSRRTAGEQRSRSTGRSSTNG